MTDTVKQCKTCKWCVGGDECRRYPPKHPIAFGTMKTRFQQVHPTDWCGEHTPKEPTP